MVNNMYITVTNLHIIFYGAQSYTLFYTIPQIRQVELQMLSGKILWQKMKFVLRVERPFILGGSFSVVMKIVQSD